MSSQEVITNKTIFCDYESGLREVARLFILTNMRMGDVESLGHGFPDESLYAIFVAYDYLVDAHGKIDSESAEGYSEALETLDAAHAVLCVAYLLAAYLLLKNYDDRYADMLEHYGSIDMSAYEFDGRVKALRECERSYQEVFDSFVPNEITAEGASFFERCDGFIQLKSLEERSRFLEQFDVLLVASQKRYDAFCVALPAFEKAREEHDEKEERVDRIVGVFGRVLDVITVICVLGGLAKVLFA